MSAKNTHTEKALSWVARELKNYKGLSLEPRPRNFDLVHSYRNDAENGDLLEIDVQQSGAPSKVWRGLWNKNKRGEL